MLLHTSFLEAVESPDPLSALRDVAKAGLNEGATREQLLSTLEDVRGDLRASGRDADEDAVLELMDMIAGWSAPHMKL